VLPGGRREFIIVDAGAGKREPAFDPERVAAALSKLNGGAVDAEKLPIDAISFGENADELVLVSVDGAAYRLDLRTYALERQQLPGKAARDANAHARQLTEPRPSRKSTEECDLTFVNSTSGPVELFWLDTRGNRQSFDPLQPKEHRSIRTFVGHVWVAVDRKGQDIAIFEAAGREEIAIVEPRAERSAPATLPAPPPAPRIDDAPDAATRPATPEPPRRPRGRGRPGGATSPDGKWALSVKDNNLFVGRAGPRTGEPLPLTSDGKAGDDYSIDRAFWSPDSAYLVAVRREAAQQHEIYTVNSSPRDQLEPKLRTLNYLKPGDKIARSRPMLFHIANRTWIPISDVLFPNPWSIGDIRWSADSSRFTFVYNQRGHQVLRLVAVDAATGAATTLVDEKSDTFIDYSSKFFCRWLSDAELLWASERDGHNHLYLYDARTGRVKNQVTRGDWMVQNIDRVDSEARQIYFRAGGVRPGQDPYYVHACRVDFDGGNLVVLTEGDGTHSIEWSPDGRYFIDTWSRVDLPPVTELRRGKDGAAVCPLESADAREVFKDRGERWPVRMNAKGRDGKTDIYGVAWLPRNFDPNKKYPVLENVYAGPQGFFTPKRFSADWGERQRMADRGMIVIQSDGMGTNGRSKAFHDVCWKNLKDAGFEDRIALIRAAAKETVPQMDLTRVGIYGGSAGGQNAMAALLWHHDFYKVAVADCGCHDNRMDKIWWNEQWMGWPVDASYERSSNVVNAKLMEGRLMLIVGELDDNVDPSSTFQTAAALQRAGKDFELVVVIGAGHGAAETAFGKMKRASFLQRHLLRKSDD
jgi:dipeptidyl aminopeptidase/acylaminoacyl peptidase